VRPLLQSLLCRPQATGARMLSMTGPTTPDGKRLVTVARGDGIGPEIMDATTRILDAAGAKLKYEYITIGEEMYLKGNSTGMGPEAWDSINRTKLLLKAPITTPLGTGVKSINVTTRKTLGLFSNVRPVKSYDPFVKSLHRDMDMVIIRENEEDLYAGIEHRHTSEVLQCIKLITIPGCERIARYAFEYARRHGRRKVTCVTKNNIMKLTDGAFHDVFRHVAQEYPDIESNHMIVDIATARVASKPSMFDVILTLNLYGDIISDVAAEVAGSVGLAGSANIGETAAMFEAVHGSAPDIAHQDIANPAGLINAAVMMLSHIGQREQAALVKDALLCTLEDGLHPADIYRKGSSKELVGTKAFSDAVIARLGKQPTTLRSRIRNTKEFPPSVEEPDTKVPQKPTQFPLPVKSLVGVDIFVDWEGEARDPEALAIPLKAALQGDFSLAMISNRGVKVWPNGHPDTYKVNHWRCRYMALDKSLIQTADIAALMGRLNQHGLEVIKTENLYDYDGKAGYSMGQGQ
jgi:isocitrate dehydrogenase